jgi:hypothetical protein
MLDLGVALNPTSVMAAAGAGDIDFVRSLHKRGLPLWEQVVQGFPSPVTASSIDETGTLVVRRTKLEPIWKAFRYGAVHGAPVFDAMRQLFTGKRRQTCAVLRCFKAAARLSQGPGPHHQRWAGMAALPSELGHKILILADLEIWETMAPPAHVALVRQG